MPSPDYRESKARSRKKRAKKYRDFLDDYKLTRGCETCGYKEYACALQFDHIDPSLKSFHLSRGRDFPWNVFLEEIGKCRVLCANCHAVHTHAK